MKLREETARMQSQINGNIKGGYLCFYEWDRKKVEIRRNIYGIVFFLLILKIRLLGTVKA